MIALIYVSSSTIDFQDADLVKLLEAAHENNAKQGITGLLLYNGAGTFIQTLEGDDDKVDELYSHIKRDTRHRRVTRLMRESITQRSFSDWKMGFRKIDKNISSQMKGYSDFWEREEGEELVELGTVTKRLMESFKGQSKELVF